MLCAALVLGAFAISASTRTVRVASVSEMGTAPPRESGAPADNARTRRRCKDCGRIVSIQRVEATDTALTSYEFTVRMRDGSLRTSEWATPGKWRVGDRIMMLGGAANAAP